MSLEDFPPSWDVKYFPLTVTDMITNFWGGISIIQLMILCEYTCVYIHVKTMNIQIIVTKIEPDNMTRRLIYTILTPGFNDYRVSAILRICEVWDIRGPSNILCLQFNMKLFMSFCVMEITSQTRDWTELEF
jgi:hypothetical protein